jgi:hypothetical protein
MACFRRKLWLIFLLVLTVTVSGAATSENTRYSQTSNQELRQNAFLVVKRIRELVYSHNKKDRELLAEYDKRHRRDMSSGAAKAVRQQWLNDTDLLHESTMRKYKEQYWSDAILLANEILRRLPKEKRRTNILPIYQHPTNVLGVQAIADHLEQLAKSLRDERQ